MHTQKSTCTFMHKQVHVHAHTSPHAYTVHMHMCVHTNSHAHTSSHVHAHTEVHVHMHAHTAHMRMHAHTSPLAHTNPYAHVCATIHVHMHVHTHTSSQSFGGIVRHTPCEHVFSKGMPSPRRLCVLCLRLEQGEKEHLLSPARTDVSYDTCCVGADVRLAESCPCCVPGEGLNLLPAGAPSRSGEATCWAVSLSDQRAAWAEWSCDMCSGTPLDLPSGKAGQYSIISTDHILFIPHLLADTWVASTLGHCECCYCEHGVMIYVQVHFQLCCIQT